MKQPTKDALREQLALAATEQIRWRAVCEQSWAEYDRLHAAYAALRDRRWWHRFFA